MPQSLIVILRILHIASGAIWFGAIIVVTYFLMPSVTALGPAGGQVMKQMVDRKYPQFMMLLMGITILSGVALMWWSSAGFSAQWMSSRFGQTLSFGAAFTILAALFGTVMARPTMMRMQKLAAEMQGGAPSAEQGAEMKTLQGKMATSTKIVAVLMTLAAAAMASARYL